MEYYSFKGFSFIWYLVHWLKIRQRKNEKCQVFTEPSCPVDGTTPLMIEMFHHSITVNNCIVLICSEGTSTPLNIQAYIYVLYLNTQERKTRETRHKALSLSITANNKSYIIIILQTAVRFPYLILNCITTLHLTLNGSPSPLAKDWKIDSLSRHQLQVLIVKYLPPFFPLSLKSKARSALVLQCCPGLIYEDKFQGSYSKLHGP